MIDNIGGSTSQLVKLALDAALQKHNIIANNIANANTPEFIPYKLNFDTEFTRLVNSSDYSNTNDIKQNIDVLSNEIASGKFIEPRGTDKVELDVEIAEMAENVVKYRALLEGLSKHGAIIKMAIMGQGS